MHCCMYLLLVQGIDFIRQSVSLAFTHGDSRMCHTVDIIHNNICEPSEDFFANLTNVSGTNIIILQGRTRVLIEDSNEPECGELNA